MKKRVAQIKRVTKETQISLKLNIDGAGKSSIKTGIAFFDHMLTLFAKHSTTDLTLTCKGDLEVDAHHTVEDCGIALGQAFLAALGDKKGIRRYGTGFDPRNPFTGEAYVTMDECLARSVVDSAGDLSWSGVVWTKWRSRKSATQKRNKICHRPFDSVWRRNFFKDSPTKPVATCIWNCFTAKNRIMWLRRFSRLLHVRRTSPASAILEF